MLESLNDKHINLPGIAAEQAPAGFAKEFANAFLYSAAESPWKGLKQLVGGQNLPELNIAHAPQAEPSGTGKWFAQEIGGAAGGMVPFLLTALTLKKICFAAPEVATATRIPLDLTLKQSAIAGFVDNFVTQPTDQNGAKFWQERALNGVGGAINITALAGGARFAAKLLPFETAATSSFGAKILQNTVTGALAGIPAGLAGSEYGALRSARLLPTADETKQSLLGMVVVGGAFGGGQVLAERTGVKAQNLADSWRLARHPELKPSLIAWTAEPVEARQPEARGIGPKINANILAQLDTVASDRGYLYEPAAGHDATQSAVALTQSNHFANNFEIAEPLVDGFQAMNIRVNNRLWEVTANKPFPKDKVVTIVVDKTADPTLSKVIEQARARFNQPGSDAARMPQELAKFVREKMFSRSFLDGQQRIKGLVDKHLAPPEELVNWSQVQEGRHARQMADLGGKKVLLGSFVDLAQRNEGFGVCIQQAMLYKVLADQIGLPGTNLVMGAGGRGKMSIENPLWMPQHAWDEVPQNGQMVPIDVINGRFGEENGRLLKPGRDVMMEARPKVVANWLSGSDTLAKAKSLMKLIAKANNYVRLPDAIPASIFMGNDTLFGAATAH